MRLSARPRHRRRRAAKAVNIFARNPIRRRRRRVARRRRAPGALFMRSNPIRHRRRRASRRSYRRNPIGGAGSLRITSLIMPAAGIAAGAIGVELAMGYLPIPANFKTGNIRYLTRGVLSLAGGWGIAKFGNRKLGEAFALGGLAIAMHDGAKALMIQFMPSLQFGAYMRPGGMGYYSAGQQVPAGNMGMGLLPARVNSPGGPSAFGIYSRAFGGHAADGGPDTRMGI